jgi:hypothetical protein
MADTNHDELNPGDIHVPHNLTYPDAANRIAGTNEGTGITVTADNLYQLAKQDDNDSLWMLIDVAPLTWLSIAPGTLWSRTGTVLSPATPGDTARVGDGTVSLPAYSFDSTTDMGMYRAGPLELGFSVSGTQYLSLSPAAGVSGALISVTQAFLATNGSVSVPSYSFTSDQDTGWYSDSADAIKMGLGGVLKWTYGASTNVMTEPLQGPIGTAGEPTFTFAGGSDNGIFSSGSNSVKIACNASETGEFAFGTGLTMVDGLVLSGAASNIVLESNTQTSGNVVSIKSTPGSASTAVVMRLEADGTNWDTGSGVLRLITEDNSALPLTVEDGLGNTKFTITRLGNILSEGDITLNTGGTIGTTANGDITFTPNGTGKVIASNEFQANAVISADAGVSLGTDNPLYGPSAGTHGAIVPKSSGQAVQAMLISPGTTGNYVFMAEYADRTYNFAHPQQTCPTFFIQSENQVTDEYLTLAWNNVSIGGGKGSYLGIKSITEEVTVSVGTGSTGVTTSGNLAPANSNIKGIAVKVTQAAGSGALSADIGITGSGNQDELIDAMDVTSLTSQVSPGGNDGTHKTVALPRLQSQRISM